MLLLVDDGGLLSAVGVATAGVVAVDPSKHLATAGRLVRPGVRTLGSSRLRVALKDSASALSALYPANDLTFHRLAG